MFWGMITAMISGALMSIQGVFNTEVSKQTSMWVSASFVQLTAFIVCIIAWFVTGREASLTSVFDVSPKYLLLGGAIGAFITYTVVSAVASLGPAKSVMFIVTAQVVCAYLIELFGLFGAERVGFEWQKVIGLALTIGGIIIFKW
ncbi:MAG: DMT family transporter [Lachnospiraceae bacterium]|nr:DMT family transporter [Lachnospiraceae bacterium]